MSACQENIERKSKLRIVCNVKSLLYRIAKAIKNKKSDTWIGIWTLLDLAATLRYKKRYIMPGVIIPGPNNPKDLDSFLYPGLHHLSAIQLEGLRIWDAEDNQIFTSNPFLAFSTADAVAMAKITGWVGHHGGLGCRMFCGLHGRNKPGGSHYYPALLKPHEHDASTLSCLRPDVDINALPEASPASYQANLALVLGSRDAAEYADRRLQSGISKPSIFSGISNSLPIPKCFPGDVMHHTGINLGELLLPIWRGKFKCSPEDNKATWDWAVLKGDVWIRHGQRVADAKSYIPICIEARAPRNPAEKINSGYKACEYMMYLYGLGPGIFYGILPDKYWENFCKLVYGVRIIHQHSIPTTILASAHQKLLEFVIEYELLYYQRKDSRLHFCTSKYPCHHSYCTRNRSGRIRCWCITVDPGANYWQSWARSQAAIKSICQPLATITPSLSGQLAQGHDSRS